MKEKTFKISAIRNGTVIDHISTDHIFKVMDILKLNKFDDVVTMGTNLESKKMGKKGLIKTGGRYDRHYCAWSKHKHHKRLYCGE